MSTPQSLKISPSAWLRRLDFLSPWGAWALGIGGGALAGAALAGTAPGALGVIGFLGLLGAAAGLAASGEPIAVVERAESLSLQSGEQSPAFPTGNLVDSLLDLVEIPGGSFLMGSPESEEGRHENEGPVHQVRISPFFCMRIPVTRRLYAEILGADPSSWPEAYEASRPVNKVSWFDAITFCNCLSEREGLDPCYLVEGRQVLWNRLAGGYRLLTEAEWEYACRAGTTSRWSFGDDEERLGNYAWFGGNSNAEPQPVGGKLPNAWGLHDMHGNVWEWCWDWYGSYTDRPLRDPAGPAEGTGHLVRGGAFGFSPWILRTALRISYLPTLRDRFVGFRFARSSQS